MAASFSTRVACAFCVVLLLSAVAATAGTARFSFDVTFNGDQCSDDDFLCSDIADFEHLRDGVTGTGALEFDYGPLDTGSFGSPIYPMVNLDTEFSCTILGMTCDYYRFGYEYMTAFGDTVRVFFGLDPHWLYSFDLANGTGSAEFYDYNSNWYRAGFTLSNVTASGMPAVIVTPLPGGLPLLAGGLAAFAWAARCRQRKYDRR